MSGVRLTVTLSGGAALGAYQAGAMAALLVALERIREDDPDAIALDSIGGASAGSLVALLSATSHLCGLDPVALLHTAWVEEVSLDLLLDHRGPAPLGAERLRAGLRDLLVGAVPVREPSATEPIALHVALSGLRGLTYRVRGLRGPGTIPASTYSDWVQTTLEPGLDRGGLFTPEDASPADAALASAANPGVFPPRLLDRSADAQTYAEHGIEDLPEHGRLWFTDGGVMQTEPVGRVLARAGELHGTAGSRRLALLVDPRSEGPSTGHRFGDPDHEPSWLGALARTLSILPAQILYEDLRRVERDNGRLELTSRLAQVVADAAGEDDDGGLVAALRDFVAGQADPGGSPTDEDDLAALLGRALRTAAGIDGKTRVDVDVLTPLLLVERDDEDIEALLAGDLLGDLGGFLDRSLRHSDFVLGYATTLRWLPDALEALELAPDAIDDAVAAVRDAHDHDWRAANVGRGEVSELPASSRMRLVELAGSAAVALFSDAVGALDPAGTLERTTSRLRDALRAALSRSDDA